MRAKRKLIVSMLAIVFVLLAVVATIAITFALTQQTIKTTLNISYTVEDIDGTASATYTIGGVTEKLTAKKGDSVIGDTLVFRAGDTENAGNLMFPEDALELTSANDNVVIQYTYSNTGDKHYIASMSFDALLEYENMKVEYSIDGTNYSTQRYAVVVPAHSSDKSYWIRIKIDNKAYDASFNGDFNWNLEGCDPQSKEYLSLTSVEFQSTGTEGEYQVSFAEGSEYVGNVVFPSEVNGDPVTKIVKNASLTQEQKNQVTSVYIPDSVETIGESAFRNYQNLQTVTFEQNEVTSSASVQNVTGLTTIGAYAFDGCKSLREFTILDSVTSIGNEVFSNCTDLTSVTVGVGAYASITKTGINNYTGLTTIKLTEGNIKCHIAGNCLIETDSKTLILGCKTSTIPTDGSVTSIGNSAFRYCRSFIGKIVIPDGITSIGDGAFYTCSNLTEIVIPEGVISIGSNAFYNCLKLTNINIPNSVTKLGDYVFMNCNLTGEILLPGTIGVSAFHNCKNLTSVAISQNISSIGNSAFYACSNITNISVLSNNISGVDKLLSELTKVNTVTYNIETVALVDTDVFVNVQENVVLGEKVKQLAGSTFLGSTKIKSVIISDSVETISSFAFENLTKITEITIPSNVTSIGNGSFRGCTGLQTINYNATNVSTGNNAFREAGTGTSTLIIGANVAQIPSNMFKYSNITTLNFAENSECEIINGYAFQYCNNLQIINLPNSLKTIGNSAFMDCNTLEYIKIPSSVELIDRSAISWCDNLSEVDFSEATSLTTIAALAFEDSYALASVNLPENVNSIGTYAFEACNITSITVDANNKTFDSRENCNAIINKETNELVLGCSITVIPTSVISIGDSAFRYNTKVTSVLIPNTIKTIGVNAFRGCSGLTQIVIPSSVQTIQRIAFGECVNLKTITFAEGSKLTTFEDNVFWHCTSLETITIPSTVTTLGYDMFDSCTNLKTVIFEENSKLEIMGHGIFNNCTSLETVSIPNSVVSIGKGAFAGCTALKTLTINSTGWWYAETDEETSGTSVDLNTNNAIQYLSTDYAEYYLKRTTN